MWINVEYLPNINKYNTGYEHEIYVGLFLFIYMLSILYFVEKRSVCSQSEFFLPKKNENIKNKNKKIERKLFLFSTFFCCCLALCVFFYKIYILCLNVWCFVCSCAFCMMFFLRLFG